MFSWGVQHVCSPFEHWGSTFDICQKGSWKFLRCSDPSERNHRNHHLLWNSIPPSPLMPQTFYLPSWGLLAPRHQTLCVSEHAEVWVWLHQYMHICFSVCDPECFLGGPGVCTIVHFQLRRELGLPCRKHVGEEHDLLPAEDQPQLAPVSASSRPGGTQPLPISFVTLLSPQNLKKPKHKTNTTLQNRHTQIAIYCSVLLAQSVLKQIRNKSLVVLC